MDLYLQRGASSSKSEIHQLLKNKDAGLFPGSFCKILPDIFSGDPNFCYLMHADGAGTKASLAYLYWKETGDISVFKGIATDSLIMNLDDLACVGALDAILFSNTIGRNKHLIPFEVLQQILEGYEETIALLSSYGIYIQSAGGETADVGDIVRTIIIDSTLTTRIQKQQIIDVSKIQSNDQILGFASFGKATWETEYNSGIGSNGLTSARHDLLHPSYARKYPETYSPETPKEFVYCGSKYLTDILPNTPLNFGKALLSPTRTYAPLIKKVLQQYSKFIHGILHCSGGAQTKCLKFGNSIHYIKNNLFPFPPLFQAIQKETKQHWKHLIPVYNMGHRLEMFVSDSNVVNEIIELSKEYSIEAKQIGYCQASKDSKNHVTIEHQNEQHTFHLDK